LEAAELISILVGKRTHTGLISWNHVRVDVWDHHLALQRAVG